MAIEVLGPRFLRKVHMGPHQQGCWLWIGGHHKDGYGSMNHEGKSYLAHRYVWEKLRGKIDSTTYVCHTCDVPACVNPAHLFTGTQDDNMKDAARKKRTAWGTRSPKTKLSDVQVQEIRALEGTLSRPQIARLYGIANSQVWYIHHRISRRHTQEI